MLEFPESPEEEGVWAEEVEEESAGLGVVDDGDVESGESPDVVPLEPDVWADC
ncbi:hypothetical protein DOT_4213 [Desulfosporosinus sp. OT]|nr:hypothetical protein DOT_4213 [Desulfosporosinus sp. OT]